MKLHQIVCIAFALLGLMLIASGVGHLESRVNKLESGKPEETTKFYPLSEETVQAAVGLGFAYGRLSAEGNTNYSYMDLSNQIHRILTKTNATH